MKQQHIAVLSQTQCIAIRTSKCLITPIHSMAIYQLIKVLIEYELTHNTTSALLCLFKKYDAPSPEKNVYLSFLQNYNIVKKCLRNVNNVTIVNKIELLSTYEYICILMQIVQDICTAAPVCNLQKY